jgi:hypothetical protein
MSDIYDALITGQADPAALAAALRQKEALGTIGSLTGIPQLQKLGPQMVAQAAGGAQDYATLRDRTQNQMLQRSIAAQSLAERTSHDRAMEGLARSVAASKSTPAQDTLSPEATHDAVIDILADPARMRQYASFGQAGQTNRTLINNEKAKTLKELGLTEQEVIRQQAVAKGQIKSVAQLVPMKNAIQAYEEVARGNGARVLELVNKVNTTGVPVLNSLKRLGEQATGNPDAAELMQVLQNYKTEAARIIANPALTGQLTDSARKEIANVVPANMTPAQAERIVKRLNFEFDLRTRGIDQALESAQGQMTPGYNTPAGGGPVVPADPAAGPPAMSAAERAKAMGL